ncbi:MAG: SMP-30/gluconolactonase/LRE family protein [Chloroflexi bacterium]|nr:MAG: SMP-30/gluconolactonase/LRE family protein [Chloroflexota bacterium]
MLFASDLSVPEGPVALEDGTWLVVEMGPDRGCVTHITADGQGKRIVAKTGRPNGLAIDKNGDIWVAESKYPSLMKVSLHGNAEVIMTACNGEPFLFPNDLCFGPDGALYLTDSGILFEDFAPGGKVRPDYMDAEIDGRVYRIDLTTMTIEKIDSGIRFTNGIAFGPDDNLYVNETLTGMIYRYEWRDGKIVGGREDYGNVIDPDNTDEGIKGPDGMAFSKDGRLYCTVFGQGDVTVLGTDGRVVERIKTAGKLPTNVAFGLGERKIYVTEDEHGTLEVFEVDAEGLPLYTD